MRAGDRATNSGSVAPGPQVSNEGVQFLPAPDELRQHRFLLTGEFVEDELHPPQRARCSPLQELGILGIDHSMRATVYLDCCGKGLGSALKGGVSCPGGTQTTLAGLIA